MSSITETDLLKHPNYPFSIRHVDEILSESYQATNDNIIINYCTKKNGKIQKIDYNDDSLPIGICIHGRNVSPEVRERYITGDYTGQYDELIAKWKNNGGS